MRGTSQMLNILEDIGQLETYVLASQAVLLFLSKGCKAVALELRMPA
jgi:hypothetical protein